MKKWIALFAAMILALSLTACGGETKETTKAPEETTKAAAETTVAAKAETTAAITGETMEADLWTLIYDADVWQYEEDDFYTDEEYSEVILYIPGEEEGEYAVTVELEVSIDDPYDFRDELVYNGLDEYEYAVNNAYPMVNVGGIDCITGEMDDWGETFLLYLGREESSATTVYIAIHGDFNNENVEKLLSGLTIHTEDIGNVDGPWYWEGEPFSSETIEAEAGGYTVTSEWIPFDECILTRETFNHYVAAADDDIYIVLDGQLQQYSFDGTSLSYVGNLMSGYEFDCIQSDENGTVWASDLGTPLANIKDGEELCTYDTFDKITMHPSGTWGIKWFTDNECAFVTISGDTVSMEDFAFEEFDTLSYLLMDENNVYACGSDVDDNEHKVFVYNTDGELRFILTGEDGEGLGCVTYMTETENGFIGLDGNMREILFWDQDGEFIGGLDDSELFGTHYPWFCGADKLDDGSILIIMTEEREDQSAMELVAFKLSGF